MEDSEVYERIFQKTGNCEPILDVGCGSGRLVNFLARKTGNQVIGVDIEIREHNRKVIEAHPMFKRIEMIEGSSTSVKTIKEVSKRLPKNSKVVVCLDSDHTKDHVLRELELYKEFIPPGFYFVVFDTNTSELARLGVCDSKYINNGPKEAVEEFLKKNDNFEINKEYNKLYVSTSENGYLRRIK